MSPLLDNNAAVDQMSAQDSKAKADVEEAISKVWNQERVQTMAPDLDTSTHVTIPNATDCSESRSRRPDSVGDRE